MFLPTTLEEVNKNGWDELDVILVTGDSYIDSPYIGAAVIGKVLATRGYRVGIIAQPDINEPADIARLGEPRLFWGVTAGCVDSMVANYTASGKKRKSDDYTPGGINNRRPDRASIVYTNLIRRNFKKTAPIVLGGIEASLRRVAHYDYWTDSIRRSLLFDAKADFLLYGMAEKSTLELTDAINNGQDVHSIRGMAYINKTPVEGYHVLPAYEVVKEDKRAFIEMFHAFYRNNDPLTAVGLCQQHGDRWLIQNPPQYNQTEEELDAVYDLDYERQQHPYYARQGSVNALQTIQFSISTHRGCYGECNFCAIAVHEGRTIRSRSRTSIVNEARRLTKHPDFKGYISDVGGPTANMYGFECVKKLKSGSCADKRCLYPDVCPVLRINHAPQIELLKEIRSLPGVKKVFVASGIRYDMVLKDEGSGKRYLRDIVAHHVSGQMKIAPEHTENSVLARMGKPSKEALIQFKQRFDEINRELGKKQFLTYYLIAAYPGCSDEDMRRLQQFTSQKLHIHPEQVQIFTPTPSTYATLMYYTEMDPFNMQPIHVEKNIKRKEQQKKLVTG